MSDQSEAEQFLSRETLSEALAAVQVIAVKSM
jgi:hypothetical protein